MVSPAENKLAILKDGQSEFVLTVGGWIGPDADTVDTLNAAAVGSDGYLPSGVETVVAHAAQKLGMIYEIIPQENQTARIY